MLTDIEAFLSLSRERHQAYWGAPTPRLWSLNQCHRYGGTGRAPAPEGHVRCRLCHGSGRGHDALASTCCDEIEEENLTEDMPTRLARKHTRSASGS